MGSAVLRCLRPDQCLRRGDADERREPGGAREAQEAGLVVTDGERALGMSWSWRALGMIGGLGLAASVLAPASAAPTPARALLVGSYKGIPGRYRTIQAAVDAARPGDTILVGPGVYHEATAAEDGVLITTPGVRLRGMDRNGVIVDGTLPTSTRPCSNDAAAQTPAPEGRNGIEV